MGQYDPSPDVAADSALANGPVDAVLFEVFPDARLTELTLRVDADGRLVVTAPDREGAVRLETTASGLAAERVPEPEPSALEPVERVAAGGAMTERLEALRRRRGD